MKNYLKLLRFEEWLPTFIFIIIGYVLTRSFMLKDIAIILIAFFSFILIGSFGFIINDYFDRGFDTKRTKNRNPISNKLISERAAIILAVLSALSGLVVSYLLLPRVVFLLFLISLFILIIYSAPPFRIKERFLLDVIVHSFSVPLLFLIGYTMLKGIDTPIIMLAITFFALDIIVEILQETRDYNTDKESGFQTTVIRLGIKNSINMARIVMISFAILFSLVIYVYFPLYFLLPMVSLLPLMRFVFSKDIEKRILDTNISAVFNRCNMILLFVLIIIIPLWLGLI